MTSIIEPEPKHVGLSCLDLWYWLGIMADSVYFSNPEADQGLGRTFRLLSFSSVASGPIMGTFISLKISHP